MKLLFTFLYINSSNLIGNVHNFVFFGYKVSNQRHFEYLILKEGGELDFSVSKRCHFRGSDIYCLEQVVRHLAHKQGEKFSSLNKRTFFSKIGLNGSISMGSSINHVAKFYGIFGPLLPSWSLLLDKAYVIKWSNGLHPPSPSTVHVVYG